MDGSVFWIWLTAWLGLVGLLFAFLFLVQMVRDLQRLTEAGNTRPALVFWFGFIASLGMDRGSSAPVSGSEAWLRWGFRWGPEGETTVRIIHQSGSRLELRLEEPITMKPDELIVEFAPLREDRSNYSRAAVRGRLRTLTEPKPMQASYARIFVYPARAEVSGK